MRKKRVWRYYCEFCSKGRCQARAITYHEQHCTKNPDRRCGMCELAERPIVPIEKLKQALAEGIDSLTKATSDCPACILATIRQLGSTTDEYEWSYDEARERFWANLKFEQENQAQQEILAEMYGL